MTSKPEEEKKEGTPLMMRTPVIEDSPMPDEKGIIRNPEGKYTEPSYDYICIRVSKS